MGRVEDLTTVIDGVGGGERSATTTGDSIETLVATVRAAKSSKVEARAGGAVPESGAQRPVASKEQATHPEMSQGMVGRSVQPPCPQGAPPAVEEEDGVEEIEREGSQTQTVRMFCKRGEEIVVVEKEDTTREVKRLRSPLCTTMKQIEVSIASAVSVFGVGDYGPL